MLASSSSCLARASSSFVGARPSKIALICEVALKPVQILDPRLAALRADSALTTVVHTGGGVCRNVELCENECGEVGDLTHRCTRQQRRFPQRKLAHVFAEQCLRGGLRAVGRQPPEPVPGLAESWTFNDEATVAKVASRTLSADDASPVLDIGAVDRATEPTEF